MATVRLVTGDAGTGSYWGVNRELAKLGPLVRVAGEAEFVSLRHQAHRRLCAVALDVVARRAASFLDSRMNKFRFGYGVVAVETSFRRGSVLFADGHRVIAGLLSADVQG